MSDLLVNLAALRTEFNQGQSDIVRQFMPLIGHALKKLGNQIVSESELQRIIYETMEFQVPFGAIRVFINRAANRRYNYLVKNSDGTYTPNQNELSKITFDERLKTAKARQKELFNEFSQFCASEFSDQIDNNESERYFFEILFDIAPIVMRSLADPIQNKLQIPHNESESSEYQIRYRIYRFVSDSAEKNNVALQYIEEFIHGAIMAESLFYSTPAEALHRMLDVKVFLDTPLLLSLIGLSDDPEVRATRELIDLLKILKARIRCFADTKKELHGIIFAVYKAKERGAKYRWNPGDVGEIIDRKGYDLADLAALLAGLDEKLSEYGIAIENRPPVSDGEAIGIDEVALADRIRRTLGPRYRGRDDGFVLERRLQHDIDCVRAVFQLRNGKPVQSLEKFKAIFVTTASVLARETSDFFTEGDTRLESTVPICIGSSVFTMLMWLKATDRKPQLTKDRLVANSIAALRPSADLWDAFIKNLRAMLERGDIDQAQFDYIANAMETRTMLMVQTEGDLDAVTAGTTDDIRQKVLGRLVADKEEIIKHKDSEIEELQSSVKQLEATILEDRERQEIERQERERVSEARRSRIRRMFYVFAMIAVSTPFLVALSFTIIRFIRNPDSSSAIEVASIFIVNVVGCFALFFIPPWKRRVRSLSDKFANKFFIY